MPTVSIIIPCFNQARFLAQAIESALGQSHFETEVVVIDDGSRDDTPKVAARFLDNPRFKYVYQANTGLPGARNRGIIESAGDYLCFLDSDDFLHPKKVGKQAAVLDSAPGVGFVYCDITTVDENGGPLVHQYSVAECQRTLDGDIFESLMQSGYFPPHTVLIRRSVLDQVGPFDRELGGYADYELWLRASGAGFKAAFVPERLAFYRMHANNMSKDIRHMNETRLAALRKIARLYPDLVASGVCRLQDGIRDLFAGVQQETSDATHSPREPSTLGGDSAVDPKIFRLIQHISEASLSKGQPNLVSVWDAKIDGVPSRALFMQPPAELKFTIPTGARGRFVTAVAIHPDAWTKLGAGACEFHLRADGRVVFATAIDPANRPTDRHWHELTVTVPENAGGSHELVLETRRAGSSLQYIWAVWRAPFFVPVS